MTKRKSLLATAAIAFGLVAVSCGGEGATVNVELKEFSISPDETTASAGDVKFVAENTGTQAHELVVLKTDLAPDALPVTEGAVDESARGVEAIGEIEEFAPGTTEEATFSLEAGNHVLICNVPGHYESGMHAAFEVT
jgi:uncharacterized cupredoxin-like copper-binding protein